MAKFRKKPIVIDAVQWTGSMTCLGELQPLTLPDRKTLQVVEDFIDAGLPSLAIQTLEGEMIADLGDWIIKGVKGELYPCKPDIFTETYEKVEE